MRIHTRTHTESRTHVHTLTLRSTLFSKTDPLRLGVFMAGIWIFSPVPYNHHRHSSQCSLCTCHSISASITEQKIGSQSKFSPNCQIPWPAQLVLLLLPLSLSEIPESTNQSRSLDVRSICVCQTDVPPSVVTLLPSDLPEIFRHWPSLVALLHCLYEMMSPLLSPIPITASA